MSLNYDFLTSSLNPSITVGCSHDFVREVLNILLSCGVLKSTSNKTLGSEDSVFRVGDGLYI